METVRVAGAVVYEDGRILACRRAEPDKSGLERRWELPGGKLQEGETSEQALRRELREELDVGLQVVWLYDTVEFDYPSFHLSMDVFVCTLAPGAVPRPSVHDELRWLSKDELLDVEWLPADVALMRSLGLFWDDAFGTEHL